MSEKPQQQLNGAQRLDRLEHSVFTIDQALGGQAQMQNVIRQATRLLGRQMKAIITLSEKQIPITENSVAEAMEDQTVEELKDLVEGFKKSGNLVVSETITPDTMFVARETNANTGLVTKKRIQSPFMDVEDKLKPLLLGKKVGDIVRFDEQPFDVEILEVYKIVEAELENLPLEDTETENTKQETPAAN